VEHQTTQQLDIKIPKLQNTPNCLEVFFGENYEPMDSGKKKVIKRIALREKGRTYQNPDLQGPTPSALYSFYSPYSLAHHRSKFKGLS